MKAWRLTAPGGELSFRDVPEPAVAEPAEALIALTADPRSRAMINRWRDGTLAELVLAPVTTVTPIPAALDQVASERLAALSRCVVPYAPCG
jgi:hypothetical protein